MAQPVESYRWQTSLADELFEVGWTKTFTDPRLCAAIVDRLTFHGTIIETGTDSYRLRTSKTSSRRKRAG